MAKKNCNKCGAELYYTSYNVWFCPNDGKLPENNEDKEEAYFEKEIPSYVG